METAVGYIQHLEKEMEQTVATPGSSVCITKIDELSDGADEALSDRARFFYLI